MNPLTELIDRYIAAVALLLSVFTGGAIISPVLIGLWHCGVTFVLVGAVGALSKSRQQES